VVDVSNYVPGILFAIVFVPVAISTFIITRKFEKHTWVIFVIPVMYSIYVNGAKSGNYLGVIGFYGTLTIGIFALVYCFVYYLINNLKKKYKK